MIIRGCPNSDKVYYTIEGWMPDGTLEEKVTSQMFDDLEALTVSIGGLDELIDITKKVAES